MEYKNHISWGIENVLRVGGDRKKKPCNAGKGKLHCQKKSREIYSNRRGVIKQKHSCIKDACILPTSFVYIVQLRPHMIRDSINNMMLALMFPQLVQE